MSTQVQYRRGSATDHNTFTGALGEITVDTTSWILRVHDGATVGGYSLVSNTATQTLTNKTINSAVLNTPVFVGNSSISGNLIPSANLAFSLGSSDFRFKDLWLSGNTIYMSSAKIEANATALILTNPQGGQFVFESALNLDLDNTDANIGTLFLGNLSTNANLGAYQTFANTRADTFSAKLGAYQTYANANVVAIQANIGAFYNYANTKIGTNTNSNLVVEATTTSTSTTTGALVVAGGVGIGGPMFVSNVTAGGITSNGTVQAATVSAATIGNSGATLVGTISTASQPNITTLGGLTSFGAAFGDVINEGNLTVVGNLTVQGNTITIGSNNLTVQDSIIDLHTFANLDPLISDDGRDIGIRFHYYKGGESHAFLGWENDTETLIYLQKSNETVSNISGTYGNVQFGSLLLSNTTAATSTTTGALQVRGGVGVSGALYTGGIIDATGNILADSGTASTNTTTGALVVSGGAGISGRLNVGGNIVAASGTASTTTTTGALVVSGGVGVSGAIYAGSLQATPIGSVSASTGAFTTITSSSTMTASGNIVAASGTASTNTTTGALVVSGGAGISGNVFTAGWIIPTSNISQNLGTTTQWWNVFYGVSTQARYADLAENYQADDSYEAGTVLCFGGSNEVTISTVSHDTAVAGVVSTNPAHLMNGALQGPNVVPLALQGRVPCQVRGPVNKGTLLVTSNTPGVAVALDISLYHPGVVIGKSLDIISDESVKTIEIVVGRV